MPWFFNPSFGLPEMRPQRKYFHLLPKLSHVGTIVDDAHWGALLQSLEAREEYHRRYGAIMPDKVIDMLVRCPDFARSIAFCLDELRDNLSAMPGDGKRKAIDLLELLRFRVSTLSGADIIAFGVHEFINELQIQMNHIGDAVIAAICPVVPSKPAKEEKK